MDIITNDSKLNEMKKNLTSYITINNGSLYETTI